MSRLPILCYHSIAEPAVEQLAFLCVPPSVFEQQMQALALWGYRVFSLREAMHRFLKGVAGEKIVALTFDDGYLDNLTTALPVLAKLGFTATCFFVTEKLGSDTFDKWPPGRTRLMDLDELRAWHRAGMEVGSHTCTHPNLVNLDSGKMRTELEWSRRQLSEWIGEEVLSLAYPYGCYDARARACARDAGYRWAVTVAPRAAGPRDDSHALPRVGVVPDRPDWWFALKVRTPFVDWKTRIREALAGAREER